VGKAEARAIEEMAAKARTRDSTRVFAKRAEEVEGELRIVADPPVIIPIEETLLVPGATLYARVCGATLARAHARWGDRIAIASYLGKGDTFDRAMADFSAAHADQNERDYAAFAAAVDSGRLAARTGV
jgi:hypothetical protein